VGGDETQKMATNPHRPSVGTIPSDHIPLVVKGEEEFPTRGRESRLSCHVEPVLERQDIGTHIYTPSMKCQNFTTASVEEIDQ
jgi:hypothetical protein